MLNYVLICAHSYVYFLRANTSLSEDWILCFPLVFIRIVTEMTVVNEILA